MNIWIFNEKKLPSRVDHLETLPKTGFVWLDCTPAEITEATSLIKKLTGNEIYDQHISDCQNPQHPCFFDSMEDYDLLVFRNLTYPPETGRLDTHSVCFILFDKLLLTVSENDNAIAKIRERTHEPGRRQPTQPEILLVLILSAIVDNFLALRTPLTDQLMRWQTKLLDERNHFTSWRGLLKFKADIVQLYMLCQEQQDALAKWRQNMDVDLSEYLNVRLNDLSNHIWRVTRHTQLLESEIEALMQLHYAVISKRTNEVVRVLTVISAIFLPLTLITNIFGMNFDRMVGLQNPLGFYITLSSMVVIALAALLIFKWKRWI